MDSTEVCTLVMLTNIGITDIRLYLDRSTVRTSDQSSVEQAASVGVSLCDIAFLYYLSIPPRRCRMRLTPSECALASRRFNPRTKRGRVDVQ